MVEFTPLSQINVPENMGDAFSDLVLDLVAIEKEHGVKITIKAIYEKYGSLRVDYDVRDDEIGFSYYDNYDNIVVEADIEVAVDNFLKTTKREKVA